MRRNHMGKMLKHLSLLAILLLAVIMFGCEGDKGDRGLSGTSFGTLTGKVTDTAFPAHNLAGVTVTPSPAVNGVAAASTDTNGNYSLTLPNGNYTLTYSKAGYTSQTQSATVVATQTTSLPTIALVQTSAAVINVANASFGNRTTTTLSSTVLVNEPSLIGQTAVLTWTDANGNVIGTGPSVTVHRPSGEALTSAVAEFATVRQSVYPPGHDPIADQNDFDVPNFETLDRLQVLPIAPAAFESAARTPFKVFARIGNAAPFSTFSTTVLASSPTNTMPFVPNPGIRNVPVGQPVVIQGNVRNTYNWSIAAPTGSNVTTLNNPTTRFPSFIPDAPGTYLVTETGASNTITIYAGTYVGILTPASNNDPLGVVDTSCSNASCHSSTSFFNTPYPGGVQFFDTTPVNAVFDIWTGSGHRHIMVKAMTQSPDHYTLNGCARCHTVGFSQFSGAIRSNGFSDVARASGFTDATWRANFPNFFVNFPQVLRKSEVQCESCHGPNGTGSAHGKGDPDAVNARMTVSSDMCGNCHGEPLRHGRYQEWRVSGHGDFETAMGEGISGVTTTVPLGTGPNTSCAGCHTGQGFPLWIQQLQGTGGNTMSPLRNLNTANTAALSWLRTNNVQPQTCQVCHRVHNPGRSSGLEGALVYLRGDYQQGGSFEGSTPLLPSGFAATGVGKGALCITCHNSRNGGVGSFTTAVSAVGLHEDNDPYFALVGTPTVSGTTIGAPVLGYAAPHEACQGDVLMGRNAYFFSGPEDTTPGFTKVPQTGRRSAHSFLADTCVTCHMLKTPTDPNFGYPPGVPGAGSNHTFAIVTNRLVPADQQINALCSQCHGGFEGTGVQANFDAAYRRLLISAANAVLRIKYGSIANANTAGTTSLTFIPGRIPQVSVNGGVPVNLNTYLSTAPLPVGTTNVPASTIATTGTTAGVQRDLAKANWNISLVAPKYFVTQLNSTSYNNGTPILNASGGQVEVAGDQSRAVHNPSFVFNVMSVTQQRLDTL